MSQLGVRLTIGGSEGMLVDHVGLLVCGEGSFNWLARESTGVVGYRDVLSRELHGDRSP